MKKILSALLVLCLCQCVFTPDSFAKGGFSSGGSRSSGFSSSRSYSSGSSRSYSSPRSTTTVTRNYSSGGGFRGYGGMGYYHPMMMYPGFGMGYGYSNGLIEGLIIGSLMHPTGTTAYSGGGYSGQALLYPDGRVVDQNGYQVGTYINGQFAAVQNGQLIAQQAPQPPTQPVVVQNNSDAGWWVLGIILVGILLIFFFAALAPYSWDTTTVTTTIFSEPSSPNIAGTLKRKRENGQFFVIDPVDKSKMWLNDKDDMYEDAAGKVWRLK